MRILDFISLTLESTRGNTIIKYLRYKPDLPSLYSMKEHMQHQYISCWIVESFHFFINKYSKKRLNSNTSLERLTPLLFIINS